MKVQVSFSADTPADVRKLIATLAAFNIEESIEGSANEVDPPAAEAESTEPDKKRKPREAKIKAEKAEKPKEAETEFDFEADFNDDATPTKVDLAAIRTLVNEKATDHAAAIRATMGSFNVTKLGDLKPAQYDLFFKAINNLK